MYFFSKPRSLAEELDGPVAESGRIINAFCAMSRCLVGDTPTGTETCAAYVGTFPAERIECDCHIVFTTGVDLICSCTLSKSLITVEVLLGDVRK